MATIKYTKTKTAQPKKPLTFYIAVSIGLVAWVWLCVYASQFLLGYVFKWLISVFQLNAGTILQSIYEIFVYALAVLMMLGIPILLCKHFKPLASHPLFEKPSREELGLTGLPSWTDILLGPIGFVVQLVLGAVVVKLFDLIFPWFNAAETQNVGYSELRLAPTSDKILAFIVIAVVAPILEEFIFRGFLYGRLRKYLAMPIAIILTALLFAILHGQWNVAVNVFVTSVVLCALREITGTIYAGMLVHILKNAVAFFLLFIVA